MTPITEARTSHLGMYDMDLTPLASEALKLRQPGRPAVRWRHPRRALGTPRGSTFIGWLVLI